FDVAPHDPKANTKVREPYARGMRRISIQSTGRPVRVAGLENAVEIVRRNAGPAIFHREDGVLLVSEQADTHLAPRRREAHGVVEQIFDDGIHQVAARADLDARLQVRNDPDGSVTT